MAVIAAGGVAVIYVPQPIQTLVAAEFGVPIDASAAATTAVQAGYAVGIVLLVSLGDRFAARSQVTVQLIATAAALTGAALAPAYAFYVVMCFIAGATATIGQLLVGAALRLAPPKVRARTTAVLLGSFIVGLFTVRTALGSLAELLGWRGAVAVSVVLMVALIPLALRFAPRDRPAEPPGYGRILASIPGIIRSSATLRLMSAMHVLCFAAFIGVWATTTVHAIDGLGLSVAAASLIGLAGLLGGVATIGAAPLHAVVGVAHLARDLDRRTDRRNVGDRARAAVAADLDRRAVPHLVRDEQRAGVVAGARAGLRGARAERTGEHGVHGRDVPGWCDRDGGRRPGVRLGRLRCGGCDGRAHDGRGGRARARGRAARHAAHRSGRSARFAAPP